MKKLVLLLLGMVSAITTFATTFPYEYKGTTLYYTVINEKAKTVSVFSKVDSISGKLEIPSTVTDGENVYKVVSISWSAFSHHDKLTSVEIPEDVISIGNHAFYNCCELSSISIPKGVKSIGKSAFEFCTSLTSIPLPESVTTIDNFAFSNCYSLTSMEIPEGITSISGGLFASCKNLTSVTLPSSITSIWFNAFSNCTSLSSITIPEGVTSIGGNAFSDCNGLKEIYYGADNLIEGNQNIFSQETYEKATLHLSKEGILQSSSTEPWKYFNNIKEHNFGGVNEVVVDEHGNIPCKIYNLNGQPVDDNPVPGVYILKRGLKTKKILVK